MNEEKNKNVAEASESAKAPAVKKSGFNKRNFKHGTLSVVLTIVFIAVLVVFNIVVGLISERFNTSADLSGGGIYSIDDKTADFLHDLDSNVTITVLNDETEFEAQSPAHKQVNEILKKMAIENSGITIDYLILDQNPNFSARFKGETLAANYIVVESPENERYRIITGDEYITIDQEEYLNAYYASYYSGASFDSYDYVFSNIEQEAVSAMMYVSNDDPVRIAFTEGYNELDSTALQDLLTKNGYDVEKINLTQVDEIDRDIDFVVMFAPLLDVDVQHIEKLDKYLDNGGSFGKNVVYFASAQQPETPNIEAFLNDWGMSVGYSVVGQSDSNYLMSYEMGYFAHYQNILDTQYAGSVYGNKLVTYGADLRPVIQIWEDGARGGVEQEIIMQSYDNAFLYPLNVEDDFDLSTAESGIYNDAVVAYRVHSSTQDISRLAVFGSDMLAYSGFMGFSNSNNGLFLVNMFNHICGREEGITITPKSFTTSGFDMTAQQANILAVVLCIVIPVVVITLGIVIWVRRRHR